MALNDVIVLDHRDTNYLVRPRGLAVLLPKAEIREYAPAEPTELLLSADDLAAGSVFEGIVGHSAALCEVLDQIRIVAPMDATVLIQGESGTGKDLLATEIHRRSNRGKGPFVALNCAALPEHLIESELFGFEKGAFTGATAMKRGKFELANGGVLFLDEVGDMSLSTQAKLLRVLETRRVERLGGTTSLPVDVRIVSATNKDLAAEMEAEWLKDWSGI